MNGRAVSSIGREDGQEMSERPDSFRMYLYEISKHPVLGKVEEREIAYRIYRFQDRSAEQRLVIANLRLVVKIAMDYYSYHLNVLDLIQEGNVGLLRAVRKFNPERGTRFSTYASFWIRAYILKYLMDSWSIVKVGTKDSQRKLFYGLSKVKERLREVGHHPFRRNPRGASRRERCRCRGDGNKALQRRRLLGGPGVRGQRRGDGYTEHG